jgi:hypothetical protein
LVADVEDVPGTCARPHDPGRPVVRAGEGGKPPVGDARGPRPARPGWPAKHDGGSVRGGAANLFLAFGPAAGWGHVEVAERKASADLGRFLRAPGGEHYPGAERIVLACDNPPTRGPAARYEASGPAAARRLAERPERRYTPRHGSWPNAAGMGLTVAARRRPGRRPPDRATPRREVPAWEERRDAAAVGAGRQFTTTDARRKLKRLHPAIQLQ